MDKATVRRLGMQGFTLEEIERMDKKEWAGKHLETMMTSDFDEGMIL